MNRIDYIAILHSGDAYAAAMWAWWIEGLDSTRMSWWPEQKPGGVR